MCQSFILKKKKNLYHSKEEKMYFNIFLHLYSYQQHYLHSLKACNYCSSRKDLPDFLADDGTCFGVFSCALPPLLVPLKNQQHACHFKTNS